jgi:hypothetical protein
MSTAYHEDFFTWTQEQAAYLKQGRFDLLDLEHLAEEVIDMGKSEQRELAHRFTILIGHLLKLQIQTDRTPTNEKAGSTRSEHSAKAYCDTCIKTPD